MNGASYRLAITIDAKDQSIELPAHLFQNGGSLQNLAYLVRTLRESAETPGAIQLVCDKTTRQVLDVEEAAIGNMKQDAADHD